MNNYLIVTNILKKKNKIQYDYTISGKWEELLIQNEKMFVEFEENVENVPDSIAIIPLLVNVLPISWIYDITIKVNSIDKNFYKNIPMIKKGYIDMYPEFKFLGNLEYDDIENNTYKPLNCGSLFSGGVDAYNTLFLHIKEKPELLTVWGSDISLDDVKGWKIVKENNVNAAKRFNLKCSFIKSNFRTFINYSVLSEYVSSKIDGEWWHEFQHGIGILGLFAPLAYLHKYNKLYIASSLTKDMKEKYTCASYPTIDNNLKFGKCHVVHDAFEMNRQEKIKNICNYFDGNDIKKLPLRVCWESKGGENCCSCEKCYRTILGIIAEKKDPNVFGFKLTKEKRKEMMQKLPKMKKIKYNFHNYYADIQKEFTQNYEFKEVPEDLRWFMKFKFKDKEPRYLTLIAKIKEKFKK